ncbi:hypothetical protein JK359_09005 [Streptomyces actinomycinicus]|uniref:Secreted protein n=1 Tax=Streptomyces actinomycinicus TaxID=1695166 RepID=A0A937JK46_9ACTN|nr:hypothetical protein [Streptomyces actinomycinicus]MBL1082119.1 hypothetical protein [Streptomyces actinomycinicus]
MGMKTKVALGAVVGIVVIGAVSANAGNDGNDSGSRSSGKGSSASADRRSGGKKDSGGTRAAETKKAAVAGDGEYQVGSDVKPGTYRTSGNTDDMCYWERAKDASGEMDSLLANDNVTGTSYVTVKPTDKVFKSSGCKDWEAVDPKAKGTPASSMAGDGGMFKVGSEIAPGTYKSTGNADDNCYWERTKDAEHGLNSIIANNNVSGTAVVTISSSDAYFKTTGCGDWKKA